MFLLALSVFGYKRSGVRALLFLSGGLSTYIAFTVLLLIVANTTDWLSGVECVVLVSVDAAVLIGAVVLSYLGGRYGAGSS